jgi:sirohydrochlorin ferrochelatase
MLIAAVMTLAIFQAAPVPEACAYDRDAMLALAPEDFDQDLAGGWRPLGNRDECREAAADLLAIYRQAHWGDLNVDQLHTNYWHEGQLRAALGQKDRAVRLLLAGVSPSNIPDGKADYAIGTVAFLLNDLPTLQAARARLAATPPPPGFEESSRTFKERYGRDLVWPLNLDVLDGLIACFGKPYGEAYSRDCRPAA